MRASTPTWSTWSHTPCFRAARRFGVPMIGLRGISDGRSELTGIHDWTEYLHIIDEKTAAIIEAFPGHVSAGRFRLEP